MKTNIGLSEESLTGVIEILNTLLADEYVLYTKSRKYHWNVVGLQFSELHRFFEEQYSELNDMVDEIAERVRQLGAYPPASLQAFASSSRLQESKEAGGGARDMIADLLGDHEALARRLRKDLVMCDEEYGDAGTNDFLTQLLQKHEKAAWMLRSSLEEAAR